MRCHLRARQAQDLRQDVASSLRFSHGPFAIGDKIWNSEVDPGKIKHGKREGKWTKGKDMSRCFNDWNRSRKQNH